MIGLCYLIVIILVSILCGEIRYQHLKHSKKDNAFVIDKNWENSVDKDYGDFGFDDSDIREAISCEMAQVLR